MKRTLLSKLITWSLIPIFGILLFSDITPPVVKADSPDPYQKANSQNSGVVMDHFNPDVKKQWSVPYYPMGMPIIAGNSVFYLDYTPGGSTNAIRAMDIYSKSSLWSYPSASGRALCPPVYANNVVYTCEDDILALDATTGGKLRTYPKVSDTLKYQKIAIADGYLLGFAAYGTSAQLYAFDLSSNSLAWSRIVTGAPVAAVVVYNHKIFFNTNPYQSYTEAINLADGKSLWQAKHYGMSGELIFVEQTRKLYDPSRDWAMDIDTGVKSGGGIGWQGWPFSVGDKLVYYSNNDYGIDFTVLNASTHSPLSSKRNIIQSETISSNQLSSDNKIYFVTNKHNLLEMDMDGNLLSSHPLSTTDQYAGKKIMIDHGRFFVYNAGHGGYEFQYYDHEPVVVQGHEPFSLKSPYVNSDAMNSYLGQLHCHYIPDLDWSSVYEKMPISTPAATEERYRDAGYDFVALTEHNAVTPDPGVGVILHIADAEEDTQESGGNHILAIGINTPVDQELSDQGRLDNVANQGGLAFLPHPNTKDYPWSLDSLLKLKQYAGIEVYNQGVDFWRIAKLKAGDAQAFDKLDKLLLSKKKTFLIAGDDYSPGNGGFDGAAVVVFSETETQADILKNLKSGNFYALQGSKAPRIGISSDNKSIIVTSDRTANFKFIGKGGVTLKEEKSVTSLTYSVSGDEVYVRAEVEADGKKAWSQPIFINPSSVTQTASAGIHNFDFSQAKVVTNTDAEVTAGILDEGQKPENAPLLGYLSPVYSFATEGIVHNAKLAISYANQSLFTHESNLFIFTYNELTKSWEKVPSTVDSLTKTVKADLPHFSLYTLSAEIPDDTTPPTISLTSPTNLTDLQNEVSFAFEITDDNAVVSTGFAIDDNPVESTKNEDTNAYTVNLDTNFLSSGNHKFQVYAEDFKGNKTEKEFDFTVQSSFIPTEINLTAPAVGDYLYEASNLSGTFTSSLPVSEIQLYLDDIYLENLEPTVNGFKKLIDWSEFKKGAHKLRVVLRDTKGNEGVIERDITVGEKTEATIVSPMEKSYFHSEQIPIEVNTMPEDAQIIIKFDGREIANHANINAYDYALREHKISVFFKEELIVERTFTITTSIDDQMNLIKILYENGNISNEGIMTAIISRLETALFWELLGWEKMEVKSLERLIKFIEQQYSLPKAKIDSCSMSLLASDLIFLAQN